MREICTYVTRSFLKAVEEAYRTVPSVSIDYGLMKTARGAVVPLETGWNDFGPFDAFFLCPSKER